MSERCTPGGFWDKDRIVRLGRIILQKDKAHNPDQTSAGQVGSSGLLVAREGKQQLGTTGSQLGPLVARIDVIDNPCGACQRCNGNILIAGTIRYCMNKIIECS
jgi:hypothetical protein